MGRWRRKKPLGRKHVKFYLFRGAGAVFPAPQLPSPLANRTRPPFTFHLNTYICVQVTLGMVVEAAGGSVVDIHKPAQDAALSATPDATADVTGSDERSFASICKHIPHIQ